MYTANGGYGQEGTGMNTDATQNPQRDVFPSMLPSLNLSSTSNAMRSDVSWCRICSTDEESLGRKQHKHAIHELHYVYEGELKFDFSNIFKPLTCQAGEYIFIPAGIAHSIEDPADYTRKLVIGFDITSDTDVIRQIFNEAKAPIALRETQVFHELSQALMYKSSTSNLITSLSVGCIVHTLLLEIVDSLDEKQNDRAKQLRGSEDSYRVDQILSYIKGNMFKNITINDIAVALGLGVRQTSRVCSRLFGCSLNQLIVQVRIKEICALLTNSKYSIAEIAEIAGFSSPYSFSRHFSHYTGVTPSAYRRNFEIQKT